VLRAQRLRTNYSRIPRDAFEMRKHFLAHGEDGVLSRENVRSPDPMAGFSNPRGGMMFNGMEFQVIQILLFQWVNYFFSGFVVSELIISP